MDTFDDGVSGDNVEVDPAAEFLAKEQEQLGDIGEDLGLSSHQEGGEQIPAQNEDVESDYKEVVTESDDPVPVTAPNYAAFGSEPQEPVVKELPECLKKWKVEQEEMLREKDANEEVKKGELRAKAAQELEDWYKHYNEQLEKTRKANKEHEASLEVPEVNGIVPGQEWERVSRHCDFSAKAPGHTKDVSRMRSILLQLKQNPPTSRE